MPSSSVQVLTVTSSRCWGECPAALVSLANGSGARKPASSSGFQRSDWNSITSKGGFWPRAAISLLKFSSALPITYSTLPPRFSNSAPISSCMRSRQLPPQVATRTVTPSKRSSSACVQVGITNSASSARAKHRQLPIIATLLPATRYVENSSGGARAHHRVEANRALDQDQHSKGYEQHGCRDSQQRRAK